ncbi:MAG: glucosidase [Simkaniaceae bacterium]
MDKLTKEEKRLIENKSAEVPPWHKWGPYVSERSWGTVREDYSEDGDSWNYLNYDKARIKAYRWGEDGIAGFSDRYQILCLSFAFWNGKDPFLKERLFGLDTNQGNHGEDVKEYYYYLDALPTHSYMKYLYKYPFEAFPYQELLKVNGERSLDELEYELIDTGVLDNNRYFDIEIEYAKITPEDIAVCVTIQNRSDEEASLHLLPHLWFRNTWSYKKDSKKPQIEVGEGGEDFDLLIADDSRCDPLPLLNFRYQLDRRYLYIEKGSSVLMTENETNEELFSSGKSVSPFTKDAFHRYICQGENEAINPEKIGTKAAFHFKEISVAKKGSKKIYLRLSDQKLTQPLEGLEELFSQKKKEADEFYETLHSKGASEEEKAIQRQALAGMLWSKQIYLLDVNRWMVGDDPSHPPPTSRRSMRNIHWRHLISKRILSMPDKWEYPWFAAWDLAFQTLPLALVDLEFAKDQLWLLLFDQFQHPNGQIPAYEWEFSDLNPPVQAWAAWRLYKIEEEKKGKGDMSFLKKCFNKLVLNFVWWVNRIDSSGNNVFEGGFLGLDNITVIDRSEEIPGGGRLEQSDGTGWMGMFCLLLMRIAIELSKKDNDYEVMATKFFEHYVYIAAAMENSENRQVQIWNERDGFFYDVLSYPDGHQESIFVRSLVGIIPLYALDFLTEEELEKTPEFRQNFHWFLKNRQDLTSRCITELEVDGKKRYVLALTQLSKVKRVLSRVFDPDEFRSPFGLRSLSKFHAENPYELLGHRVEYEPGESRARLKGGNSNWRGPVWFPTAFLLIDSLKRLHEAVGEKEKIPTKEGEVCPYDMARKFAISMIDLFKRNEKGERPIYGEGSRFQTDEYFKDHILFFEHYHGETGRGLGASHQTGWSGLVANLIEEWLK